MLGQPEAVASRQAPCGAAAFECLVLAFQRLQHQFAVGIGRVARAGDAFAAAVEEPQGGTSPASRFERCSQAGASRCAGFQLLMATAFAARVRQRLKPSMASSRSVARTPWKRMIAPRRGGRTRAAVEDDETVPRLAPRLHARSASSGLRMPAGA